jgi:spoIIIJ-associated protein
MVHRASSDEKLPEFHIDVAGYRQRQADELVTLAQQAAEAVRKTGNSEILRPMNAFERRVVHVALADMTDLATESIGVDPNRRIIIKPK